MGKYWLSSYPPGVPAEVTVAPEKTLVDLFHSACDQFHDHTAVSNDGTKMSYALLMQSAKQMAVYLQQTLKLSPGDRVALLLPNCLQYYVAMFGVLLAGQTVVNINPLYTRPELHYLLKDSGASTAVVMSNFAHVAAEAIAGTDVQHVIVTEYGDMFPLLKRLVVNFVVKHIKRKVPAWQIKDAISWRDALRATKGHSYQSPAILPTDIAFLQYTGGTTGVSKGAMLSHQNILVNAAQCLAWTKSCVENGVETMLAPLPLYHIFTLTLCCFAMLQTGNHVLLITDPRDIPGLIKVLASYPVSMMVGLNTLYNALNQDPALKKVDFSHLKLAIAGGMPTQQCVSDTWLAITGQRIVDGYGLTETSPVVTVNPLTNKGFKGSVGLPLPSTDISVRDEEGRCVATGEVGELWVRGPQVMQAYWQMPAETALVMSDDGWLKTGDYVRQDELGYLFIVDRKKDMILVSGFNVYPNEVEAVLASHPGVLEVGVVGVPATETGEMAKAFVVRKDPHLCTAVLKAHCRENLAGYKCPQHYEFVETLPKSNVGKVLRRELKSSKAAQA